MTSMFDYDDSVNLAYNAKIAGKNLVTAKHELLSKTGDFLFLAHSDRELAQRMQMVEEDIEKIAYRKLSSISDSKAKLVRSIYDEWSLRHANCNICKIALQTMEPSTSTSSDSRAGISRSNTDQTAPSFTPLAVDGNYGPKTQAALQSALNGRAGQGPTGTPTTGLLGQSGGNIKQLQQQLNNAGFNLAVDGQYGPKTEAAVKQFQTQFNKGQGNWGGNGGLPGGAANSLSANDPRSVAMNRNEQGQAQAPNGTRTDISRSNQQSGQQSQKSQKPSGGGGGGFWGDVGNIFGDIGKSINSGLSGIEHGAGGILRATGDALYGDFGAAGRAIGQGAKGLLNGAGGVISNGVKSISDTGSAIGQGASDVVSGLGKVNNAATNSIANQARGLAKTLSNGMLSNGNGAAAGAAAGAAGAGAGAGSNAQWMSRVPNKSSAANKIARVKNFLEEN